MSARPRATGPCEYAGPGCTGRGRRMVNPLAVEVDGDDSQILLCDPCADSLADDA